LQAGGKNRRGQRGKKSVRKGRSFGVAVAIKKQEKEHGIVVKKKKKSLKRRKAFGHLRKEQRKRSVKRKEPEECRKGAGRWRFAHARKERTKTTSGSEAVIKSEKTLCTSKESQSTPNGRGSCISETRGRGKENIATKRKSKRLQHLCML